AIALRAGRLEDAQDAAARSLRHRPGHVRTLMLAARTALARDAADLALPLLREAATRAPDAPEPAFLLLHALLAQADPALEAAIARTATHHPGDAAAWQDLAVALQRKNRPALALAAFTRAATANPTLAPAHFGRGLLLRSAERLTEAQAALSRAVALDPALANAWFALGLTCQDLSDEAAAAAAFRAALEARADFAEAAVNLGIAEQRLGKMDAALGAYRQAVRTRPETLGRIAQAMTTASTGILCLRPSALRALLNA
ncbi:MAG TPA: tetratricopeptide repeat protein, partial [Rhodopila sp.]|nr:tetratricopeptide repeat protein [Rhodopila sp.]